MSAVPTFSFTLPVAIEPPSVAKPSAKKRRFSVNEAPDAAWGRWKEILFGFGLPAATLRGRGGPCPRCKGNSWFRLSDLAGTTVFTCKAPGCDPLHGDGFEALQHIRIADSYRKAEKAVVAWLNRNLDESGALINRGRRNARPNARLLDTFMAGSRPLNGTGIVARYFVRLGLAGVMRDLPRIHVQPALPYFSFKRRAPVSPALIAQLVD